MKRAILISVICLTVFVVLFTRESSAPQPETTVFVSPKSSPAAIKDVPFTPQAPFGGWDDPRQQDGCEEASALMAVRWARGESLTKDEALREMLAIADFEQSTYGSFHDTDAKDTVERIFNGYFHFASAKAVENISIEDIKNELYTGHLVLVPVNGQLLGNPNFTGAGPERHMLVIISYDSQKNQFTTNDPGTRRGKDYKYDSAVLQNALREYPTGNHDPITTRRTSMIVVARDVR